MNNKTLLYIFAGLLVIYLASRLFSKKSERSFDVEIVNVDTSKIDQIKLYPKAEGGQEIVFVRTGNGWSATKEGLNVAVPKTAIQGLLTNISNITVERVVSKSPEKWIDYEVDEANGTRVIALQKGKSLADFIVGRFNFDQMARSATSYIRKNASNDVYAVDGFLGMSFNRGFDSFRDKELINTAKEDITQLNLQSPTLGNHRISKQGNNWSLDSGSGLDSAKMASWVNEMSFATGSEFVDGFDQSAEPLHVLEILANNQAVPVSVIAYAQPDSSKPFVIHSTSNPQGYFASDSSGVYSKFFKDISELTGDN